MFVYTVPCLSILFLGCLYRSLFMTFLDHLWRPLRGWKRSLVFLYRSLFVCSVLKLFIDIVCIYRPLFIYIVSCLFVAFLVCLYLTLFIATVPCWLYRSLFVALLVCLCRSVFIYNGPCLFIQLPVCLYRSFLVY